jgi:hypothetical protein
VTVVAVGSDSTGNSAPSAPSKRVRPTAGPPGSPSGVKATPQNGSALITWTAPAGIGDGIAHYTATAAGTPDGRACVTPNGATLSCLITGLTNGSDYQITVVAVGKGASGNSGPSTPPITVRPGIAPGAPTNVVVTPAILTLNVQFTPGSVGDGVASYTATAVGGASTGPCVTANISTTPCVIKGVTAGTTYTVTVVANGTSAGLNSLPSEPSSPVRALAWPAPTLPSPAPADAAIFGPASSSAGVTLQLGSQTTISGNTYAPFTGITVGLYQGGAVRTTSTTMTDSTGAFSLPVTISGSGLTAGSAMIVAAGMQSTGTVRYRALTVTLTSPALSLSRMASPVVRSLPAADLPRRFTLNRAAR